MYNTMKLIDEKGAMSLDELLESLEEKLRIVYIKIKNTVSFTESRDYLMEAADIHSHIKFIEESYVEEITTEREVK